MRSVRGPGRRVAAGRRRWQPQLRRALFSATMLPAVEELATTVLRHPVRLVVGDKITITARVSWAGGGGFALKQQSRNSKFK